MSHLGSSTELVTNKFDVSTEEFKLAYSQAVLLAEGLGGTIVRVTPKSIFVQYVDGAGLPSTLSIPF